MKFKCKNCRKFIVCEDDNTNDIVCVKCGTVYAWMYERGGDIT